MTTAKIPEELDDAHPDSGQLPENSPESDKEGGAIKPEGGPWGSDSNPTTAKRKAIVATDPDEDDKVETQGGPWGSDSFPTRRNGETSTSPEKSGDGAVTPTSPPLNRDDEPTPSQRSV